MNETVILDGYGNPLPAAVRTAARRRYAMSAAYSAASNEHASMAAWRPGTYSGHSALGLNRDVVVDRINDAVRNSGWASAGVTRLVDNVVGSGWRLSSKPNARTLNLTEDEADEIGDQIEALWSDVATDPRNWFDAERTKSVSGILGLAARHRFTDGEAFAVLPYRMGGNGYGTCVHVIDPARLSNPMGQMDTETLRDGVELDEYGAPIGYHVRKAHAGDVFGRMRDTFIWDHIEREDEYGRPLAVHSYEATRAGMTRGASRWAPILQQLKQVSDYNDYELQAASLNAVMAAFIKTPFDMDQLADSLGASDIGKSINSLGAAQAAAYAADPIRLKGAQINFLNPGEDVVFTKSEHPNAAFEVFVNAGLRNIASCVGLTYEQLTMDWSKVNYSSARAALLEIWRGLSSEKSSFAHSFMQPIYWAWLEEVFDQGRIRLPARAVSFEANPAGWVRAAWIGSGRGWVDPEKEAKAAAIRLATGLTTQESESAEQGRDWKEDTIQRARELRFARKHGVTPGEAASAGVVSRFVNDPSKPGEGDEEENK